VQGINLDFQQLGLANENTMPLLKRDGKIVLQGNSYDELNVISQAPGIKIADSLAYL
jgi:hypothetical protein